MIQTSVLKTEHQLGFRQRYHREYHNSILKLILTSRVEDLSRSGHVLEEYNTLHCKPSLQHPRKFEFPTLQVKFETFVFLGASDMWNSGIKVRGQRWIPKVLHKVGLCLTYPTLFWNLETLNGRKYSYHCAILKSRHPLEYIFLRQNSSPNKQNFLMYANILVI